MNIYTLTPLISCVAYLVLIVITIAYAQRKGLDIFLLYLVAAMLWSFFSFQTHANFYPGYNLLWHKFLIVFLITVAVTYYHFISTFTNRVSTLRLWIGYGLIVIIAIFTLSGYVIKSSQVTEGLLYYDIGVVKYILAVFGTLFMFMAIHHLVQYYRYSTDTQARNRAAHLIGGVTIVLALSLTNLSSSLSKYPIDHIGNLANALIVTYVVVKYRLMDIRVVIRKGLSYSGLTVLITAVYLLLLFIVQMFIKTWAGYSSLALAALFAFVLAILFNPLRNVFQEWVDRIFYRETYDYRQMLLNFSHRASNILDLNELAKEMLYPINKALYVTWVSLMVYEDELNEYSTQFALDESGEMVKELRFIRNNPVVSWLDREGKPLSRDLLEILPEFKGLWAEEINEIRALELELLVPIKSKGHLIGILALGKKKSDRHYSSDDIDLLMIIVGSSGIAIENARMLATLKKEQLQVRRLLAQTVQAQEDERKRIAAELHDSVTQWLVGASYRIQVCTALLAGSNNSEVHKELSEVENTMDESLKELRRLMRGLHPPALTELGVSHAIQQLVEQLETKGISCRYEITGTPTRLLPSLEITIFRIVQESFNNIQKHAGATEVEVRLCFQTDDVLLEIKDNGKGFNLTKTMDKAVSVGSLGLLGMKQRAETIGGTLKVDSRPNQGTSIVLICPLLLVNTG